MSWQHGLLDLGHIYNSPQNCTKSYKYVFLSRVRLWSSRVESRTVLPIVINKFKPKYDEQKYL